MEDEKRVGGDTKINFEVGFNQATTFNAAFQIHNYDLKNSKDCAKSGITISVTILFSDKIIPYQVMHNTTVFDC